ncbi:MAG: hypothetical protein FWF50_03765 [Defluviitaleaceae bacterium]|nr:hypothetical protein [Defluviitaleaceae bacterium]
MEDFTKKIYIIHENDDWTAHLTKRLDELDLEYEKWHLNSGIIDFSEKPPLGIFYNRMSASSHTRGHRYAPEIASAVIDWLEFHNAIVLNGSNALRFEVSKIKQSLALEAAGIRTPKTIAASGKAEIVEAGIKLQKWMQSTTIGNSGEPLPFITKHNRAGKGLGVQLFRTNEALEKYVNSSAFEDSIDGITILQEYIEADEPYIYRNEFIGGKYVYTVRVDTSSGFELCPADACQVGNLYCPAGERLEDQAPFKIVPLSANMEFLIERYESFLKNSKIDVAGIEMIVRKGIAYTYDINTNTNYNSDAEKKADQYAMLELAKYLGGVLAKA